MANYCDTKVNISGEPEDLQRLFDKIGETTTFSSENYQNLFESVDDVEDWGSKWQVMYPDYSGDSEMYITGESAWTPADGLWKKISKDYNVQVTLEYSEPGMGFAGVTSWSDGEETSREEMTYYEYLYNNDIEYFWEDLGYQCEYETIDDVISTLGELYDDFSDSEKQQLQQLHEERYVGE